MVKGPSILIVSAEFHPLAKTGGLGDMVRAITDSLRDCGFAVRLVLPGYSSVLKQVGAPDRICGSLQIAGEHISLCLHRYEGMDIVVVRSDGLFDRPGDPYRDAHGKEWSDLAERFAALCRSAAHIINGLTDLEPPDLLHLHDWHAALTPAYIKPGHLIPIVMTVHNFMFQGRVTTEQFANFDLEQCDTLARLGQHFGGVSILQIGLHLSDVLVTVSKNYAKELKKPNRFNWWYLGDDQNRSKLTAIPNWPNLDTWSPISDDSLISTYGAETLSDRFRNRMALEKYLGWSPDGSAIFCTVSRITKPKGFGFLVRRMTAMLERDCRIVIVGDGDRKLLNFIQNIAEAHPRRVALVTPYDENVARRVLAGADMLLMPSLTEPCGLTQQQAQVYGCVPIVSKVGGLPDTVSENRTGYLFEPSDPASFLAALDRALGAFATSSWRGLQRNCMKLHAPNAHRADYARLFWRLYRASKSETTPEDND